MYDYNWRLGYYSCHSWCHHVCVKKGKLPDVVDKIPLDKAAKAVSKAMEKSGKNGGGSLYTYAITVVIGSSGSSQQKGRLSVALIGPGNLFIL